MITIWKYTVIYGRNRILIPKGFNALPSFRELDGELCFWAEVIPENEMKFHVFYVLFTEDELPQLNLRYLGTTVRNGLVYHLYMDYVGIHGLYMVGV